MAHSGEVLAPLDLADSSTPQPVACAALEISSLVPSWHTVHYIARCN